MRSFLSLWGALHSLYLTSSKNTGNRRNDHEIYQRSHDRLYLWVGCFYSGLFWWLVQRLGRNTEGQFYYGERPRDRGIFGDQADHQNGKIERIVIMLKDSPFIVIYGVAIFVILFIAGWATGMGGSFLANLIGSFVLAVSAAASFALIKKYGKPKE